MDEFLKKSGEESLIDFLIKWIVITFQPLNVIENPHFRNMIDVARKKGASMPAGKTIEKRIEELSLIASTQVTRSISSTPRYGSDFLNACFKQC